jgi:hypothetical protein
VDSRRSNSLYGEILDDFSTGHIGKSRQEKNNSMKSTTQVLGSGRKAVAKSTFKPAYMVGEAKNMKELNKPVLSLSKESIKLKTWSRRLLLAIHYQLSIDKPGVL